VRFTCESSTAAQYKYIMVHIDGLHAAGQYAYLGVSLSQTGVIYHAKWTSGSGTGPQGPFKPGTIIRFGLHNSVSSTTTPRAMQAIEVDAKQFGQNYAILFQL
jgi:hypothetical protein